MAKFDRYDVTRATKDGTGGLDEKLGIIFEDGDEILANIEQARSFLLQSTPDIEVPLRDRLLELGQSDFFDLLLDVCVQQMIPMGNGKYAYANQLRELINQAQNT